MDFLGLTTLTVLHDAVKMQGAKIAASSWTSTAPTLDDEATYKLFSRGENHRHLPV